MLDVQITGAEEQFTLSLHDARDRGGKTSRGIGGWAVWGGWPWRLGRWPVFRGIFESNKLNSSKNWGRLPSHSWKAWMVCQEVSLFPKCLFLLCQDGMANDHLSDSDSGFCENT